MLAEMRLLFVAVLLVMVGIVSAVELKVDFGNSGTLGDNDPPDAVGAWTQWAETSGSKTIDGITFTLSNGNLNNGPKMRDRQEGSNDLLTKDAISEEDPGSGGWYQVEVTGLTEGGSYRMRSYHNNCWEAGAFPSGSVSMKLNAGEVDTANLSERQAYTSAGVCEYTFTASSGSDTFKWDFAQSTFFNGFILQTANPSVQFESAASGAFESVSPAVLNVVLSEAVEEAVTVDYEATGGTATGGGVDYNLEPGTLTFLAGETCKTIDIEIIDDGLDEEDETIEVTLSNLTGGEEIELELGTVQHVYTIIDQRPSVEFDVEETIGLEDVTPANIAVSLSAASPELVTVDYSAGGGTATGGGIDYTLDGGRLVFDPCETTKNISIMIVDDDLEEETETIELTLSNPVNAKMGIETEHTYRISDDELAEEYTNSIGMELVRIEAGSFWMGSNDGDFDEKPAHDVTISRAFYMGKYEVTNAQYEMFDPGHGGIRHYDFDHQDNEAVILVTWDDANDFCRWLSEREGRRYRLPTEAEWEYACRAWTTSRYFTGDDLDDNYYNEQNQGNTTGPDPQPLHVGTAQPNSFGLYDMHGNVEEWCCDWYGPYASGRQIDPVGMADGDHRVTRGGSHSSAKHYLRSANRLGAVQGDSNWLIGFRVVMGEMPGTEPLAREPARYQTRVSRRTPADIKRGPDANAPYFYGPRRYVFIPDELDNGPLYHDHNHVPGIVECPNGDLLIIWYSTEEERDRELSIAASRLRYGDDEWEAASVFWLTADRNNHTPCIWGDHKTGKLYHFNGVSDAYSWTPLAVTLRTSLDNGVTWSKPRVIIPEHDKGHMPIESVFRASDGTLVLPCDASPGGSGGTFLWMSSDDGQSWRNAGGKIAGIHAAAAQLSDGRLLAFGRSDNIDGRMPKSVSNDMGRNWDKSASEFDPIGSAKRCVLLRLKERPLFFASFGDDGLFGSISWNDGDSWSGEKLITDGSGREVETLDGSDFRLDDDNAEPKGYLSICQGRNGVIHLISSRQHYAFNLKWMDGGYTPAAPCPADLNNDRSVDGSDLKEFMDNWLWSGEQLGGGFIADLDEDADVDLDDFAVLASQYNSSCP